MPGPTALAISHAIPSDVFHGLKSDRWNSADSNVLWGVCCGGIACGIEGVPLSVVELVAQGHCTTWVGIALLSCQCNAVLSGALVPYLVHCFVAMKPVTLLQPSVSAGLKPVTPLRGENVGFSGVEGSQW